MQKLTFLKSKFLKLKQNTKYQILTLSQKKIFEVVNYQNYEYLMLIYPDSIFSENYITNCLNLIQGKDAVLSPGPLVTLEEHIEYLKKIKKPYKLKNLVNFTNQNLHPFYKSLINQKKFDFVNIFEKNNLKIFNCFDLHISILRRSLCDSKIDFNTIDSDYLEKLKLKILKFNMQIIQMIYLLFHLKLFFHLDLVIIITIINTKR